MGLFKFLMIADTTKQEIVADLRLQSFEKALLGASIEIVAIEGLQLHKVDCVRKVVGQK
jgi:hypothetical protein